MVPNGRQDVRRNDHGSTSGSGFGLLDEKSSIAELLQVLDHRECGPFQVDIPAAQTAQLALAQLTPGGEEHDRPEPGQHCFDHHAHLGQSGDRAFVGLLGAGALDPTGGPNDQLVCHCGIADSSQESISLRRCGRMAAG